MGGGEGDDSIKNLGLSNFDLNVLEAEIHFNRLVLCNPPAEWTTWRSKFCLKNYELESEGGNEQQLFKETRHWSKKLKISWKFAAR